MYVGSRHKENGAKMIRDNILGNHRFTFNKHDNGGEHLILKTTFIDNGDKENNIYTNQELVLCSYCNEASFKLIGIQLTPELLRKLADELEAEKRKLVNKAKDE